MVDKEEMDAAVLEREMDHEVLVAGQKVFIYGLCEPHTVWDEVRYVGKTQKPRMKTRYNEEKCKAKNKYNNSHRDNWIRSVLDQGEEPRQILLDIVEYDHWQASERFWIAIHRAAGYDLTNWGPGGEGSGLGELSPVTKVNTAQVIEMRERYASRKESGESTADIAASYGMSVGGVHDIVTGTSWGHVGGPIHVPTPPLTGEQREEIRSLSESGWMDRQIAELYGRSITTINIVTRDVKNKINFNSGDTNVRSKLNSAIVTDLRLRAAGGEHLASLGAGLSVNLTAIYKAVTGGTWKKVATPPVRNLVYPPDVHSGERNPAAKLCEADVITIRRTMTADIKAAPRLARQFGVSQVCIWKAATGDTWGGLREPTVPHQKSKTPLSLADKAEILRRIGCNERKLMVANDYNVSVSYINTLVRKHKSPAGSPGAN